MAEGVGFPWAGPRCYVMASPKRNAARTRHDDRTKVLHPTEYRVSSLGGFGGGGGIRTHGAFQHFSFQD